MRCGRWPKAADWPPAGSSWRAWSTKSTRASAPTRSSPAGAPTAGSSPSRPISTSPWRTRASSGREIETSGRAAHGSRPAEGIDAIVHMGRVLGGLEALDRALQSGRRHPRLGTASLHASTIAGGRELSSYPDRCTLQVERRTLPGEPEGVPGRRGRDAPGADWRPPTRRSAARRAPLFSRPPYEIDADASAARDCWRPRPAAPAAAPRPSA